MTEQNKKMYLVDGSAIFFRAYYGFIRNPLINSKGENTGATFGFINSLLKVIKDEDPAYFAVVFDTKHPTFRHKEYPDYKANRAEMPDDLAIQIPRIHDAVKALCIPSFEMKGFEADDIIGTLAKRAAADGFEVWCVTGDKDYFQLVNDNVRIYTPKTGGAAPEKMGREEVKEKFGVYPELVIDKLALMGDSSDNVPGVPGIGKVTADKLLAQFGSLDEILSNWESIRAKGVRQKIGDNLDKARLSKRLVTIDTDVPIDIEFDSLKRCPIDIEATKKLFLDMEFNRLINELLPASETADVPPGPPVKKAQYENVDTIDGLKKLVKALSKKKEIAVDTETTSLDALNAELVGVSLSDTAHKGWYIPIGHTGPEETNIPLHEAKGPLKELLENPKVQKIGQNIKYDLQVLHRHGIDISPISFDTMLASYVVNPAARPHSLDALALKHCDHKMQPITDLIGSGKSQKSFATVPIKKAVYYAAEDADFTYQIRGVLAPMIDEIGANNLYYNIEMPLVRVLSDMEEEGIRIDTTYLSKLSSKMDGQLDKLKAEIYEIAGSHFNINSTQQLSHILFDKLSLPTKGMTAKKTGYSTDVGVLESLAKLHPFPKLILDFRQLTKLKNTYIDAIPKLVNITDGRVHTSFNQTIAATGRLSSTNPNLQNIPIRTEEGRRIRKAFVPRDKDHVLLAADYSQIELRILAHYTEDKGLISAFKKGEDIHSRTAAEVAGVDLKDVTSDMRRVAKTTNFAIIYGVTAFGLSQQTDMNVEESKKFIDIYLDRYPGISKYMETAKQFARDNGYCETMFKRRRYISDINDKNHNARQFAERMAINTPIQGTAADIIKIAMIKIHEKMSGMRSKMVLQVHDELVFDVHKKELAKIQKIVKDGMEKAVKLSVPLVADMATGDNWLECK